MVLVLLVRLDLGFIRTLGLDSLPLRTVGQCERISLELGARTSLRFLVSRSRELGSGNALVGVGPPGSPRTVVRLRLWGRKRLCVEEFPAPGLCDLFASR